MSKLLEVSGVAFSYPGVKVLKDINLAVGAGESHVIIGPNGAGKTTLFKALSGETKPSEGSIYYKNDDITGLDAWQRTRLGFGRTFQVARIFPDLTVLQNMVVAVECRQRIAKSKPRPWWRASPAGETIKEAQSRLEEFRLLSKIHEEASVLSHGDKKRLELAVCLALEPRLLMLDEPTAGMSPEDRIGVVKLIQELQTQHELTLLLTEHDMDVVFGLATHLTVLSQGEIIASGKPDDVRNDPLVQKVYLGQEPHYA